MGQFGFAIKGLLSGKEVSINPRGNSMSGIIESGDTVIISPSKENLNIGSVVLVKVKGNVYLHLVKSIRNNRGKIQYQIGNNHGGINGWVGINAIYGVRKEI